MQNELPDDETNYVLESMSRRLSLVLHTLLTHVLREKYRKKIIFDNKGRFLFSCFDLGWSMSRRLSLVLHTLLTHVLREKYRKKIIFDNKGRFLFSCFDLGWKAHCGKGLYNDDAICMA